MRTVLVLLWLAGAPALAQTDTTRQRSDTVFLAPTVVTVLRAPVELSRAPFAVGVTTRDEIQRGKPGFALDEALAGIAGVQVDNRFNYALGERISIRGFGARAQFGVRGVRVLLDGIPMTLADGQTSLNNVDVAGLARAEVIRGPASALHGNAAGGVIQLETDAAYDLPARRLTGEARSAVGADGLLRHQLSSRFFAAGNSVALSGSRLSFDGYRQWHDATNDHVNFRIGRELANGSLSLVGNWVDYDAQNPGSLSTAQLAEDRNQAFATNVQQRTGETGRQGQLGGTWNGRVGAVETQLSVHGLQRHVDNPIPQRIVVIDRNAGGARLALSGAPTVGDRALRISAGVERLGQSDDRRNYINVMGERGADTLDQRETVINDAIFSQANFDLAPRLLLILGARYDRIRFEADDRLVGPGNADDSGVRLMSAVSPSVGLTWSAHRLVDVYGNLSTSFETPTTSELANQESGAGGLNPALEPQHTRSVELGINGRLRVPGMTAVGSYQLAAYEAMVRDALIPFEVASVPGRQFFRNAGSGKHRGVETGLSLLLPADLSLRASFTHTDARFVNYATATSVFDGKRIPGVAANRADATLSFQPSSVFLDFETRAFSSIPVNDANTESSPSYVIHSARAGLRRIQVGAVQLAPHVGVLNLFDRDYNTSVVVNAFGGRFYEPGPPRSVYAGMTANF